MEVFSIEWNVADDEMVKIDLKVAQINRTSFAISGTLDVCYEISEHTKVQRRRHVHIQNCKLTCKSTNIRC